MFHHLFAQCLYPTRLEHLILQLLSVQLLNQSVLASCLHASLCKTAITTCSLYSSCPGLIQEKHTNTGTLLVKHPWFGGKVLCVECSCSGLAEARVPREVACPSSSAFAASACFTHNVYTHSHTFGFSLQSNVVYAGCTPACVVSLFSDPSREQLA